MAITLGNTVVGSNFAASSAPHTTEVVATQSFTAVGMWVYISGTVGANNKFTLALYDEDAVNAGTPGNKMADVGEQTYTGEGWYFAPFGTPQSIVNGTKYFLGIWHKTSNQRIRFPNTPVVTAYMRSGQTHPNWPSDFASTSNDPAYAPMTVYLTDTLTSTKTHTTDVGIKKVDNTKTHTTDILLKKTQTKSHSTDVFVQVQVGKPVWVTPLNAATGVNSGEPLVFTIPDALQDMHFIIEYDKVNTFDSVDLKQHNSYLDQTGWEYWDDDSWEPIPASGVPTAAIGNNARYTPTDLSEGTWYRRIRGLLILTS